MTTTNEAEAAFAKMIEEAGGREAFDLARVRNLILWALQNEDDANEAVAAAHAAGDHARTVCPVCNGGRIVRPLDENRTGPLEPCLDCTDGTVKGI